MTLPPLIRRDASRHPGIQHPRYQYAYENYNIHDVVATSVLRLFVIVVVVV